MPRTAMRAALAAIAVVLLSPAVLHGGEVIEDIVAVVDGDIITRSQFEEEEQLVLSEVYRSFSGDELDQNVAKAQRELLNNMITRKILYQRARRLADLERMGNEILDWFKSQQGMNDQELERVLAQDGMSRDDLKAELLQSYAPQVVIDYEVTDRVAVGNPDVETYYRENPDEFHVPGEVTLREIVLLADDENREERRRDADAVRDRALEEEFEALAKEVSQSPSASNGGLLGTFRRGELSPLLEDAAFVVPVGEVSRVLEAPYGFHIVKVESREEDRSVPLDDVREDIRARLEAGERARRLEEFLAKAWSEAEVEVRDAYKHRFIPPPSPEEAPPAE